MKNPLISGKNVDAIFIDGKYQDETMPLTLCKENIKHHQYTIKITTQDNEDIEICFYSIDDLFDYSKAYNLK